MIEDETEVLQKLLDIGLVLEQVDAYIWEEGYELRVGDESVVGLVVLAELGVEGCLLEIEAFSNVLADYYLRLRQMLKLIFVFGLFTLLTHKTFEHYSPLSLTSIQARSLSFFLLLLNQ